MGTLLKFLKLRRALEPLLVVMMLAGCDSFPSDFVCANDDQCVHAGQNGICASNACAFPDTGCASGYRYHESSPLSLEGECVGEAPPEDGGRPRDSGGSNACGGLLPLDGNPGDPCGRCMMGMYTCDGLNALRCTGQPTVEMDVTGIGVVTASTTYGAEFEARLAVDGDLQTSWFSAGSRAEPTGRSTFEWDADEDLCVVQVSIEGNGRHLNPSFRTNYGFARVTVEVVDDAGVPRSSESRELPGTPDPTVSVMPNSGGRGVRLVFDGHESDDCGGFAELIVTAAYRP
jgi:hypothetical protein